MAAKLGAIANYEYPEIQRQIEERPRLVELLWFVQSMSLRPGGLAKFTEQLLAAFPERVGTRTMLKAAGREYSLEEKLAIWREMPDSSNDNIAQGQARGIAELLSAWGPQETADMEAKRRAMFDGALRRVDVGFFRDECRRVALAGLPSYLFALCTDKAEGFDQEAREGDWRRERIWFFGDVIGAVLDFMGRHARQAQRRLAMTDVAKLVFDALDYAQAERVMVRIEGGSRFGKTEALQTWCDMRPGLARLVRVPCDNGMGSFYRRIGEALGIECSFNSNVCRLKERIEYVVKHSGLFLVLDEGAFLIPQEYTESTAPHRLNWVRTEIVDRNLPLAIAVTPQSFEAAVSRFVKKTRYTMEQFFGRNFLTRRLPAALPEADLVAVAKIHFPEMDEVTLGYIASEARLSQNYLQAVEGIAKLARWKAARANRSLGLKDLKAAVAEVLSRDAPADSAPPVAGAANAAPARSPISGALHAPCTAISSRLKPARRTDAVTTDLPPCSFRGAGPGKAKAERISADS